MKTDRLTPWSSLPKSHRYVCLRARGPCWLAKTELGTGAEIDRLGRFCVGRAGHATRKIAPIVLRPLLTGSNPWIVEKGAESKLSDAYRGTVDEKKMYAAFLRITSNCMYSPSLISTSETTMAWLSDTEPRACTTVRVLSGFHRGKYTFTKKIPWQGMQTPAWCGGSKLAIHWTVMARYGIG